MSDKYEILEKRVAELEAEREPIVEKIEQRYGFTTVTNAENGEHRQWSLEAQILWRQIVAIKAQMYLIAFPDAKIEFSEDGLQFREAESAN